VSLFVSFLNANKMLFKEKDSYSPHLSLSRQIRIRIIIIIIENLKPYNISGNVFVKKVFSFFQKHPHLTYIVTKI
jgi:hypothetical protein